MGGAHTGRAVTIWEGRVVPGEGPSTNEEGPTCLHVKNQLCGELPAMQWTCRGTGGGPGVSTGPGRAPATEDRPAGRAGKAACRGAARARPQGGTASEPRGGEDVLPVTGCGREVTKPLRERRAPAGTGLPLRRCPGRWVRRRFTETRAGLRAARRPELGGSGRPGSRWAGRRALGAGPPEGAGGTGLDRSRRREDSASRSCRHLPPELPVAAWTGGLPDSPAASGRPDFHHTAGRRGGGSGRHGLTNSSFPGRAPLSICSCAQHTWTSPLDPRLKPGTLRPSRTHRLAQNPGLSRLMSV